MREQAAQASSHPQFTFFTREGSSFFSSGLDARLRCNHCGREQLVGANFNRAAFFKRHLRCADAHPCSHLLMPDVSGRPVRIGKLSYLALRRIVLSAKTMLIGLWQRLPGCTGRQQTDGGAMLKNTAPVSNVDD